MTRKLTFRQLQLSILALVYDRSQKEIGAGAGIPEKRVSQYLRRGGLKEEVYERLLAAIPCPPAAVRLVTACLESLDALDREGDLTPEERAEVEEGALGAARLAREALTEAALLSRTAPPDYPEAADADFARLRAEELWERLKGLPEESRLAVVKVAREFQSWALCERVCAESVTEASRDIERSASLARLAGEIAERVPGPEGWRERVRGYAVAHVANTLRVSGELKAAEATFEETKRLWQAGSDSSSLLDSGRLFDLEASLRRDQRHFKEALALLDRALEVGRSPARVLVNRGFTQEVMGDYEGARESLLQALALGERQGDQRLMNIIRCNLGFNYCHTGRFADAAELVTKVREAAIEMGDALGVLRVTWLEGRIAAATGRPAEARSLLAEARREFDARSMSYDVALVLLEEAILLLEEGRPSDVKDLTRKLLRSFESKGVHREALAALRLFQEAAEREQATTDLARRLLGYLLRARYDQNLRFEG